MSIYNIEPEDIMFAFCSGVGSQGDKANYIITRRGEVYSVSLFEPRCNSLMERLCPFLKGWSITTMPDVDYVVAHNSRFGRDEWCWMGIAGGNSLFLRTGVARQFRDAVAGMSSIELYHRWCDIATTIAENGGEEIDFASSAPLYK